MNLSSTIKSIQDIMRKDDGVDGDAQRIGQLTYIHEEWTRNLLAHRKDLTRQRLSTAESAIFAA